MEIDEKLVRELKNKFEIEMNKREVEIIEHWRRELENIYKRRYESLGSLQVDIKGLLERMGNRATILNKMVREAQ
jgi:hypothetical protein